MKAFRMVAVLLGVLMTTSACSMIQINPERDGAQVVATVNGQPITKKEVYDYLGMDWSTPVDPTQEEQVNQYKSYAMEQLVSEKVLLIKASEMKLDQLTDQENQEIQDSVNAYTQSVYDSALSQAQQDAKTNPSINPEDKAKQDADSLMKKNGITPEILTENYKKEKILQKLKDQLSEGVEPTEADITAKYNTATTDQKTSYDANPSQMSTDISNGVTICYYPEGIRSIRSILISLPSDKADAIKSLRDAGQTDQANQARDEALAQIKGDADQALAKAQSGTDFYELMKEYAVGGTTPSEKGYLFNLSDTTADEVFRTEIGKLTEPKQVTGLLPSDSGYYIVELADAIIVGNVPMENVHDSLLQEVKTEQQDQTLNDSLTDWSGQMDIKRYDKRLYN